MMDDPRYNEKFRRKKFEIFNSGKSPSSSVELTGSADSENSDGWIDGLVEI